MLPGRLQLAPEKRVPVAMALLCVGLLLVMLSVTWAHIGLSGAMGTNGSDFARGFFLGLGLVLEVMGVVLAVRAVRRGGKP